MTEEAAAASSVDVRVEKILSELWATTTPEGLVITLLGCTATTRHGNFAKHSSHLHASSDTADQTSNLAHSQGRMVAWGFRNYGRRTSSNGWASTFWCEARPPRQDLPMDRGCRRQKLVPGGGGGRRRRRLGRFGLLLVVAAALPACGGDDDASAPGVSAATTSPAAAQVEKAKPSPGTGNVQGKVLYDDQPVAGIEVKLCQTFARFGSGCSGAEHAARSGQDGEYVIADVPPGEYQALLARVFDTDSFVFAQSGFVAAKAYGVQADRTLFIEPTHLFKSDLKLVSPASGSPVSPSGVEVRWEAYPGAAHYKLSLSAEAVGAPSPLTGQRVDGTSFTLPTTLQAGTYRVSLEAFNAKDRKLAEAPRGYTFTVT